MRHMKVLSLVSVDFMSKSLEGRIRQYNRREEECMTMKHEENACLKEANIRMLLGTYKRIIKAVGNNYGFKILKIYSKHYMQEM